MIDVGKLKEAVEFIGKDDGWNEHMLLVLDAARAHLATLPREVEVEGWAIVTNNGNVWGVYTDEFMARKETPSGLDSRIVRLTGKALLPPEGK